MAQHHFDPTRCVASKLGSAFKVNSKHSKRYGDDYSCKTDDYKNFLSCATDNGNRSHVHCCKTQLVPSFCYDFCSGDFKVSCRGCVLLISELSYTMLQMLRRSHRLCLYYLPEIFECYNRAYRMLTNPPLEHFRSRDSIPLTAFKLDRMGRG